MTCACGARALAGSEMCRACWDAWWRSVCERSRIQRIAAENRRRVNRRGLPPAK